MKLTLEEKRVLGTAIIVSISGYIWAYLCAEPMIFSRFGSLVVCVGIYWGMKDYPGLVDKFKELTDPIKNEEVAEMQKQLSKSGVSDEQLEQFKKDAMANIDKKVNPQLHALKARFFKFEAWILCAGTLIWGFGDLLVFVGQKT